MSSVIAPSTASTATSTSPSSASALITSTGIGSGLDISAIVSSLTTAFGAAQTTQLTNQQNSLDSQVSAYGTFTAALDTLQAALPALEDPTQLAGFDATVADTNIASATTTSDAVGGQYSLQVNNLATAATLTSNALAGGSSTVVGTGTLTIAVGGASTSIDIDSTDNTLAGIASAINSAANNPGVTASIITTTAGSRLVLAGTATGAANAITVTQSGGDGGLSSLVYDPANNVTNLTQTQAAQDASFSINGFAATSASNVVSSALTGVTINLLQPSAADLVGVRVMVALVNARVAPDDPVEDRPDHVLGALADLVADLAFGEDLLSSGGVLRRRGGDRNKERRPGNRKTQQLQTLLPDLGLPLGGRTLVT